MSFRSLSSAAVTYVRSLAVSRYGRRAITAIPLLVLVAAFSGCSRHMGGMLVPNRPPELEILDARALPATPTEVRVRWAARDEDGTVVRTLWTLAPLRPAIGSPNAIATPQATATAARECVLARNAPVKGARLGNAPRPEPDLFTIWAVDDRGAESEHQRLALFDGNVAPTVYLTCPVPSPYVSAMVQSRASFGWVGTDPDGVVTNRPVKYKFKLLANGNPEFDINYAHVDPDSLRRFYAARNWAGWDSTSGDTTTTTYTNLTPNQTYLFVVTGFDEAGDYDPVFNFSKNMILVQVGYAGTFGPKFTVWNSEFFYAYPTGGWSTVPAAIITVEEPAGQPLTFSFTAQPLQGYVIAGYRWKLDAPDPSDRTVRTDPSDLAHWSDWSMGTQVQLGPFSPVGPKRESHTLYLEASSLACPDVPDSGSISLAIIHFIVVRGTYSHELLIVDDTRLEVDQFVGGVRKPYGQNWPSRAELDTFLFARGGFPWRGTVNPPTGANSTPGLFAGYSFDTIGTRGTFSGTNGSGPLRTGTVPLSTLADYRHVIWMVDHNGGHYTASPLNSLQPMSALHYMSTPGHLNALAEYVALGGRVWMLGGAAALASLREFNAIGSDNNDRDYSPINGYVFAGLGYAHHEGMEELKPGRLMYDAAHWRSLMMCQVATARINRSSSLTMFPDARWLDQPGYAFANPVHRPDYTLLPTQMHVRTDPASDPVHGDPLPPTRQSNFSPLWWGQTFTIDAEYLFQPNIIVEDMDPSPAVELLGVALDTLMSAQGTGLVSVGLGYEPAVMTWYHGVESPEFVFSGFPIWSWRRSDCQQLVDFVLQQIWHMEKHTGPATPFARRGAVASSRAAPAAGRVHLPAWGSANR